MYAYIPSPPFPHTPSLPLPSLSGGLHSPTPEASDEASVVSPSLSLQPPRLTTRCFIDYDRKKEEAEKGWRDYQHCIYHHSGGRLGREGVGVVYNRCDPTFAILKFLCHSYTCRQHGIVAVFAVKSLLSCNL